MCRPPTQRKAHMRLFFCVLSLETMSQPLPDAPLDLVSRHPMSSFQQHLLTALLAHLAPATLAYAFKASDLMARVDHTPLTYDQLQHETLQLLQRPYVIDTPQARQQLTWLSSVTFQRGQGRIAVTIAAPLLPHLQQLLRTYPLAALFHAFGFQSRHSLPLYLYLYPHAPGSLVTVALADLYDLLDVAPSYRDFHTFKRRILQPVQHDLQLTDVAFTATPLKAQRRVTHLQLQLQPLAQLYRTQQQRHLVSHLRQQLGISLPQARHIVAKHPEAQIYPAIFHLLDLHRQGKIRTSLAAYSVTHFQRLQAR